MTGEIPGDADFAALLDRAVRGSRTSTADLRRQLVARGTPVSEATLRSWRTGSRRPEHGRSLEAVGHLEGLLGLPTGALTSRLGPSRRLRRSRWEPHDDLVGMPGELAPVLDTIGCRGLDELESAGGTLVVDVDDGRRVRRTSNRMLWRARVDGARRTVVTLNIDRPRPEAPTARAVGAEIGRSAYDARSGWAAWEVVLPRPLRVGETAMVEWSCDDAVDDGEVTNYESVAERRVEHGGLWVRFDDRLPSHVERFRDDDSGLTVEVVEPTGQAVQHDVRDFGPGVFGIRWRW